MKSLQRMALLASIAFVSSALAQTAPPGTPATTRPSEGTVADSTPPDAARSERTTGTDEADTPSTGPASLPTQGTAADRVPPEDRQQVGGRLHPELVGTQVVSPAKTPIGKVVDVVFDSRGQPDYIVIASEGQNAALPYKTASSMMERGTVIVDEAKLRSAPKIEQGQWRTQRDGDWKEAASDYWDEG